MTDSISNKLLATVPRLGLACMVAGSLSTVSLAPSALAQTGQQAPTAQETIVPIEEAPAPQQDVQTQPQESAPRQQMTPAVMAAPTTMPTAAEAPIDPTDPEFDRALSDLLPLEPGQIQELLERLDQTQRAAASHPGGLPPSPDTRVVTLSLDPGSVPPIVYLHTGYVTTLTILDASGQPWPIHDIAYGGNFQIPDPEVGTHIIRITPMTRHGSGNMSIRLEDLVTPITLRLQSGVDRVDFRVDARVPEFGPQANPPLIDGSSQLVAGDGTLTTFLEGVPPEGAVSLRLLGADERSSAWRVGDTMYLRTPLNLLSPGWDSSVRSTDGMQVYALSNTPVVLLSDNGVVLRATIKE